MTYENQDKQFSFTNGDKNITHWGVEYLFTLANKPEKSTV